MDLLEFWGIVEKSANVIGIVSFVVSLFTFHAAQGAKKAVIEYKNVKRYDAEIEEHIEKLKGLHNTISEGDAYSSDVLVDIYKELDAIRIHFEHTVKPFERQIKHLQTTLNRTFDALKDNPTFNRRKIILKLNNIIERLEKTKRENES